ncbi:ATP-binding cassette domain-containing protein [Permianibacter aggregans]|uniref:Probable ATP-binding protein YheS n=1 Tax=Permianibacter aggregans TaxID=1510150 RepID=A0A4R6U6P4_9GAMM|nr:ATP-binding cassette domain-containing protein [Permianibacter aggregans]QGX39981.1 ATP-binding cassette domain-containing protein [Permianibacter aggregans]TDQ41322.1 ATP-binding cassette subfamily F protein 3 [Permianibacter aggregans]
MITLNELTLQRGTKVLLDHANLTVHAGEHVGLVGANGCGKSTLFALLRGELAPDGGDLLIANGLSIAWAQQEIPHIDRSALDYIIDGDHELRAAELRLHDAEQRHDGMAAAKAHAELEHLDAWRIPSKAAQMLAGLGFSNDDLQKDIKAFSGGWRMRLNLAQALMRRSDILLLDEPTNHLDLDAVIWLEQFLRSFAGTLIVISHDRDFLDGVCQQIVHIEHQKLNKYTGTYSAFERQRGERLSQQQAAFERQQVQRAHLQKFVDRFKAKASKAKQAQSRVKALEKLTMSAPLAGADAIQFEFKPPEKMPNPLVTARDVQLGYGDNVVLRNVKVTLNPGARLGLLGRNGAGKSTFIKFLADELKPQAGERHDGQFLRIGYFSQHTVETLHPEESALMHMKRLDPQATEQALRGFLGGFGFSGDRATTPVAPFSGGEKARVALAMLVWQKPNLLLMDEPTNHLDLDLRESLTQALQSFEGAMVLVSHDRHLLRACCDEYWLVDAGKTEPFDGDLDDYARWLFKPVETDAAQTDDNNPQSAAARKDRKRLEAEHRKLRQPLQNQLKKLESKMSELQGKLHQMDTALTDADIYTDGNKDKLKKLLAEQASAKHALEEIEMEWLGQQEALDAMIAEQEAML